MGRIKISNTLMCGEIGRISQVSIFIVELEVLSTKMMSSFDSCQVLLSLNFAYELSLEIQKYRLQCGRIWEMVNKFYGITAAAKITVMSPAAARVRRNLRHMRFEALKSRSSLVVDAYSSWIHWHLFAFGGGSHVFLVLLERKLSTFRLIKNCQFSIKIHIKPFKIDKNSF